MNTEKRQEIIQQTNLVINLCLMAGSQLATAYQVGAEFAKGLENEFETKNCNHPNLATAKGGGFRCKDCNRFITRLQAKEMVYG